MSIRALLCDDHDLIRYVVCEILAGTADIRVIGEAQDGAAAVQMTRRFGPDVVVMDVDMAGMNGIEATRRIVAETPNVRVLALSADADWHQVLAMLTAGASGYLHKLWSMGELPAAIRAVAAGETYLSGAIAAVAERGQLSASLRRLFASHLRSARSDMGTETCAFPVAAAN
jgi:DNA-binding NarL/FixJ family response regulator